MGLEIFMGSVWVGSLKRITEIGRDGDMHWMLKKRIGFKTIWYWQILCTKCWFWVLHFEKKK